MTDLRIGMRVRDRNTGDEGIVELVESYWKVHVVNNDPPKPGQSRRFTKGMFPADRLLPIVDYYKDGDWVKFRYEKHVLIGRISHYSDRIDRYAIETRNDIYSVSPSYIIDKYNRMESKYKSLLKRMLA